MRPYAAVLAGYYGFGNLGDDLLAEATVEMLSREGINRSRMAVLSNDPAGSRLGIRAVNRWSPREVWNILGLSETLVLGGGGLFQDATSTRSCLYYWSLVKAARLRGVNVRAEGQSVGPLSTLIGRAAARNALRSCRSVTVRDVPSQRLCSEMGVSAALTRDLVFILNDKISAPIPASNAKFLINLRPWPGGLPMRFANSVRDGGISAYAPLLGVAMSDEDEALMSRLVKVGDLPPMPIEHPRDLSEAAALWSGAAGAAGMRLHFAVLSVMFGVGALVVPYDPKVTAFAEENGLAVWGGGIGISVR
ncbi:MAG: polysaccharide pyruvyl transferase family protein [Synergistaceae bacterium]|jgi:polysaccharide pyruvyl transferase CsaB|nr:polysaccharide pyruvyl transferase family protein [Synergistaceae bacterium]